MVIGVNGKKRLVAMIDKETAKVIYGLAKANNKTIGEVIALIVKEWLECKGEKA